MASSSSSMSTQYTPERAAELKENYDSVQKEIEEAYKAAGPESSAAASQVGGV